MIKRKFDLKKRLRFCCYLRMSSDRQNPRSPEQQANEIAEEIVRQNLPWQHIVDFRDDGISGRYLFKRPEFQRMLREIRTGILNVDIILVDTAERLGRADEIASIRQELLTKFSVLVMTADSHFSDPTTDAGKALGFVEQLRSTGMNAVKSHDVLRGKKDCAMQRRWPGGPAPLGLRIVKNLITCNGYEKVESRLEPDPKTRWLVEEIFNLCLTTAGAQSALPNISAAMRAFRRIFPSAKTS